MSSLETQLAALTVEARAINRRLDDQQERSNERHEANQDWLWRIDKKVDAVVEQTTRTNGRVSILENAVEWLKAKVRERTNPVTGEGESASVTLGDLKWYIACAVGGFGAAIGLLKLMGKL